MVTDQDGRTIIDALRPLQTSSKEQYCMVLILSRADLQQALSMAEAIAAMRQAFQALYSGSARAPQRLAVDLPARGVALLMPALLQASVPQALAIKVVNVMPQNPQRDLPRIYASVLLLEADTGRTLALLEGGWLTAMRTGAVSGLATDLLALPDADVLALFGAGAQAPAQVLALHTVRPLRAIRVVNRDEERFHRLVEALRTLLGPACPPISRASSSQQALAGASLVACATTASAPLFAYAELARGAHINAVGAFTPAMREVDAATVAHARIVVDQRAAALEEAGDLLQEGAPGPETWIEIGELLASGQPARRSGEEVTLFKSVGIAVQDAAVALHVYVRARELGLGVEVELL
jgi:ornithine cyclodeaminase/alanine dehydrogenase-like protein (mu-crystallin family)